jgi:hypothetical protein
MDCSLIKYHFIDTLAKPRVFFAWMGKYMNGKHYYEAGRRFVRNNSSLNRSL